MRKLLLLVKVEIADYPLLSGGGVPHFDMLEPLVVHRLRAGATESFLLLEGIRFLLLFLSLAKDLLRAREPKLVTGDVFSQVEGRRSDLLRRLDFLC